ncbi:MAG: arylamine N-acetyltransferase [Planctomycetota bacterium]|nr:arylamine N-acetyltransferase [Planctomycetota bacterium]
MTENPLANPSDDSAALRSFCEHFRLETEAREEALVEKVAIAFSSLPYENLTKILKHGRKGGAARRGPEEVISDHLRMGSGGTCFSLTATLLHVLRGLGLRAKPILADRHYGENTHCALLVWLNGQPHLLDPGYLILRPLPLLGDKDFEQVVPTSFNEILLRHKDQGSKIELHTRQQGAASHRLTFKPEPAEEEEFLAAWDASFGWEMMRYPLLTRVRDGDQLYLQGARFQRRSQKDVERSELFEAEDIARSFGLETNLVREALAAFSRRGETP